MARKGFAATIAAKKNQFLTLGTGWTADRMMNWTFEYVLYPVVISHWGLLAGGGIMIVLSIVQSLGVIWFYDWTKRDWLGIEAVKSLRDEEQQGWMAKVTGWLMKKGTLVALIGLSIYSEPVKVTLYMRHGSNQFNGFSKRDWLVFITSVVISNVSWALAVWGGVEAFRKLF